MAMEGDADGSMAMADEAEQLKAQAVQMRHDLVTPDRTMSVCEICGVFINSTDNEQRRQVRAEPASRPDPPPSSATEVIVAS